MKNSNNKMSNMARTLLSATFFSLFIFLFVPSTVQANDKIKNPSVEIKYVGSIDYKPIFQISFDNQDAEEVFLTLRDENGVVIYSEVVKDKKYARKIQLESVESDVLKLTLTLRSKKSTQSEQFQINKSTRVVEDVVVAKL